MIFAFQISLSPSQLFSLLKAPAPSTTETPPEPGAGGSDPDVEDIIKRAGKINFGIISGYL